MPNDSQHHANDEQLSQYKVKPQQYKKTIMIRNKITEIANKPLDISSTILSNTASSQFPAKTINRCAKYADHKSEGVERPVKST